MKVSKRSTDFNDIPCEEIRSMAENYDAKVDEMMAIAVRHFGVDEDRQKQILASKYMDIAMADCETYDDSEYNGVKKPGCKYIITWYFNLEGAEKKPGGCGTESDYDLLCCDNIVYFQYTREHVVTSEGDIKARKYYDFYARVKGMQRIEKGGVLNREDVRVGHKNENDYGKPYSIFNPFVATDLALKAKEAIERYDLMREIMKDWGFEYDRIFGYHDWQC